MVARRRLRRDDVCLDDHLVFSWPGLHATNTRNVDQMGFAQLPEMHLPYRHHMRFGGQVGGVRHSGRTLFRLGSRPNVATVGEHSSEGHTWCTYTA